MDSRVRYVPRLQKIVVTVACRIPLYLYTALPVYCCVCLCVLLGDSRRSYPRWGFGADTACSGLCDHLPLRTKICTYVPGAVVCHERGSRSLSSTPVLLHRRPSSWVGSTWSQLLLAESHRTCTRCLACWGVICLHTTVPPSSSHQDLYIGIRRGSALRA